MKPRWTAGARSLRWTLGQRRFAPWPTTVYIHEGASYQVERLDLEQNLATVVPANVDFYTEVTSETQVETLAVAEERVVNDAWLHGELSSAPRRWANSISASPTTLPSGCRTHPSS
ncbi:MAG: hypothetical protein R2838_03310 [Caldilineaceae bacterium]